MIKIENDKRRYFDKNGIEIKEGNKIILSEGGKPLGVYLCADGQLGLDATNPAWIKSGRAEPCEYGLYPLTLEDTQYAVVVGNTSATENG